MLNASDLQPIAWGPDTPPNATCGYNHCLAETAIGKFLLTWKGWKSEPWQDMGIGFDETPWGDVWYGDWDTVEEAKATAQAELLRRVNMLLVPNEQ